MYGAPYARGGAVPTLPGGAGYGAIPPSMGKGWGKGAIPPTLPASAQQDRGVPGADVGQRVQRVEQDKNDDFKRWHNVRHLIAYIFTLTAFVILAPPTIISIQLGMDVDASFWIGKWGLLAIFVPIFLIGQHLYHLWMLSVPSQRRRYLFIIVPVVPAVLFMVIGGTYMSTARHMYGQLKSNDCSLSGPMPAKQWIQMAYEQAHDAYDQCHARLLSENGGLPLRRHPTLQSCAEWKDLLSNRDGVVPWKGYKVSPGTLRQHNPNNKARWQYLADIEATHMCGGFCKPGPSVFVSYSEVGHQGGSCHQFVAFRFLAIQHWGLVIFAIGFLTLVLSIPAYVFSRGFLTSMGYKSAVTTM